MADWSAKLKLPYMAAAQAQKHVTHNEALALLDAIVHLSVLEFEAATPPAVIADGAVYALGAAPTGAWAGQGGRLALASNGGWQFVVPQTGWRAALGLESRVWDGTHWIAPPLPDLQNLPGIGIGTSFSAGNPLAVAGDATLLTHAGAGHQVKINKATAGDTASLLFQTGWSGRAEMGTAGGDDFAIKVSADGSQWVTALTAVAANGGSRFGGAIAAQSGTAAAPGYGFDGDSDTGLYLTGANSLGLTAGGSQRARVHSGGLEVTGLVTGSAVQSSASDATTGRLLAVGAFGLGGSGAPACSNLDDIALRAGFYATASSIPTTGIWPPSNPTGANQTGQLLVMRSDSTALSQIWFSSGEDGAWRRRYSAGVWSPWRRVTPMVGTVAQTGGTATGAILERGSNASGEYVRFADGTQMCWSVVSVNVATTAFQSWSFPASFNSAIQVSATMSHLTAQPNAALSYSNIKSLAVFLGTNVVALRLTTAGVSTAPGTNTEQLVITTIGRWF